MGPTVLSYDFSFYEVTTSFTCRRFFISDFRPYTYIRTYIHIYIRGVKEASYLSTLFPYVINRRSIGSVHFRSGVSTFQWGAPHPLYRGYRRENQRGKDTYVRIESKRVHGGKEGNWQKRGRPLHLPQESRVPRINNQPLIYRASVEKETRKKGRGMQKGFVFTRIIKWVCYDTLLKETLYLHVQPFFFLFTGCNFHWKIVCNDFIRKRDEARFIEN